MFLNLQFLNYLLCRTIRKKLITLFIWNSSILKADLKNLLKVLIKPSEITVTGCVNYNADFRIYDRLFRLHKKFAETENKLYNLALRNGNAEFTNYFTQFKIGFKKLL